MSAPKIFDLTALIQPKVRTQTYPVDKLREDQDFGRHIRRAMKSGLRSPYVKAKDQLDDHLIRLETYERARSQGIHSYEDLIWHNARVYKGLNLKSS